MTLMTTRDAATLRVHRKSVAAEGVVTLELAAADGGRLKDWTPGSHIDLVLPGGLTRQYSLCGDRWDPRHYRLGILREPGGRGGAAYVHDELDVGDAVSLGGPRNNFPLVPSPEYLFVAGGIGITPLLPMVHQAELLGARWYLLYGGRHRASMAFLDELAAYGDRVLVRPQDEHGLLDLAGFLGAPRPDVKIYACGARRCWTRSSMSARRGRRTRYAPSGSSATTPPHPPAPRRSRWNWPAAA
jgi:ferredoxin-NADP reductase